MEGYFKGKRLVEYPSLSDFATGQNFIIHHLPEPWSGETRHTTCVSSDVLCSDALTLCVCVCVFRHRSCGV